MSALYRRSKLQTEALYLSTLREFLLALLASIASFAVSNLVKQESGIVNSKGSYSDFYQYGIMHVVIVVMIYHLRTCMCVYNWDIVIFTCVILTSWSWLPIDLIIDSYNFRSSMYQSFLSEFFACPVIML